MQYLRRRALFPLSGAHKSVHSFLPDPTTPAGGKFVSRRDAPRRSVTLGYSTYSTFRSGTATFYSDWFSGKLSWYREEDFRKTFGGTELQRETFRREKETLCVS